MVRWVSAKQALSSVSRTQWAIIVFIIIMIPIVVIVVHFSTMDSPNTTEPVNELDEMYGPVIYLNMMFRHGNRNPDQPPPKDPYNDLKYWPGGYRALTATGILQHVRLGKWIAQRYHHLLPDDWVLINDAIKVVSTDWNRTLMSAEAHLAGIFHISKNAGAWEGLTAYPVPIHSLPEKDDGLLELTKQCKKYKMLVQESKASEKYQSILRQYKNTSDYIEENSGKRIEDLGTYNYFYTVYSIEESRGLVLPTWIKKVYPSPIRELAALRHVSATWNLPMRRLRGGPFVKEVLGNIQQKLNGTSSLNISMYSAHDTSLSAAMGGFGVFNNENPPMAGLLLIELRAPKNGSEPVVMIWYKNTTSEPFLLQIPGCSVACPLSEMEQLLLPVIPDNWEDECEQIPEITP